MDDQQSLECPMSGSARIFTMTQIRGMLMWMGHRYGAQHLPEGCTIYRNEGELLAFPLLSDNNRPHLIDLKVDGLIKKEIECLKPEIECLSFLQICFKIHLCWPLTLLLSLAMSFMNAYDFHFLAWNKTSLKWPLKREKEWPRERERESACVNQPTPNKTVKLISISNSNVLRLKKTMGVWPNLIKPVEVDQLLDYQLYRAHNCPSFQETPGRK